MNYVITGSLGHISKPVVEKLSGAGHKVKVITSRQENAAAIEAAGAEALVGSVEDAGFISESFASADAVYLMIPPNMQTDDYFAFQRKVANNYVAAIKANHIGKVVVLSSVGAHIGKGTGPIDGAAYLEQQVKATGADAVMLRPSYFFYNLFAQAELVRNAGIFGSNFGGEEKLVLTDTADIAAEAATQLLNIGAHQGEKIIYISSDECSTDEIARLLGAAIDKAGTPWVIFTDAEQKEGLLKAGLPETIAEGFTVMGRALREGALQKDYWENHPEPTGNLKLEAFAQQFAAVYRSKA